MAKFKCWAPDNEEESDALEYEEAHAEYAAEEHAERYWRECAENPDELEVRVRDALGALRVFDVSVDFSPDYYASERDK